MDNDRKASLDDVIRRFGEAWARGDRATLSSLLSPTYTHIDANGRVFDREAWLAYAGGRAGRATQITFRDVRTQFLGDVAVVTGTNEMRGGGVRHAADKADSAIRFSQVWTWQGERWLRELFQATIVGTQSGDFA